MLTTIETKQKVEELIFDAIDGLNSSYKKPNNQIFKSLDTPLFGESANLDSMDLVNLIFEVEDNFKREMGLTMNLSDERAMNQEQTIFSTVSALVDYICVLLAEAADAPDGANDMITLKNKGPA